MLDDPMVADTSRGVVALEVSAPMTFTVPLRVVVIPIYRAKQVVAHVLINSADADWVNQWRWFLNYNGYVRRTTWREPGEAKQVYLHRALLGCKKGDGLYVDHINRDKLDNRRSNLRVGTASQSAQNKPVYGGRFRGVTWDAERRKWCAQAQLNGRNFVIGRFDREEDAAQAASEWRREHMPFSEDAAS